MRPSKSSLRVSLAVIGAFAITGCDEAPQQRDVYTSLENCQKDWGRPEKCERSNPGAGGSSALWYGPSRWGDYDSNGRPLPSRNAVSATQVSRGGFGSLASFHSAGS